MYPRALVVVLLLFVCTIASAASAQTATPVQLTQTEPYKLVSAAPIIVAPASDPRPAVTPADCERACSMSAAGNCKAGDVTGNPNGDARCAASRIGIPTYTKLTSFGSSGSCHDSEDNNRCASGSCTSWQGKPVYGVAHRTFPFGTTMEVCNLKKQGVCQIATVVERGPNARIVSVTVDARAELAEALLMGCNNTTQATYKVLSVPGVSQTAEPSGPAKVGLETLLASGHINGTLGNGLTNPTSYTAVQTPYGIGYLGTPTNYATAGTAGSPSTIAQPSTIAIPGSSYGTQAPVSTQLNSNLSTQQATLSQQTTTSNNAQDALTAALQQPSSPSAQQIVENGPAIANLYLQPRTIPRSGTIIASWTSLNMSRTHSCVLTIDQTIFGQGNEGSIGVPANRFSNTSLTMKLSCLTAASSTPVVTTDTVTITP